MIRSAMRSALKESLMKMKHQGKNERAKSYVKNMGGDSGSSGDGEGSGTHRGRLVQGSEKGLRSKVRDAEEDGMMDLEAQSPSEFEGSLEEELMESDAEAREEGDLDYDEAREFMRGHKSTPVKKTANFVIAVGGEKPSQNRKKFMGGSKKG